MAADFNWPGTLEYSLLLTNRSTHSNLEKKKNFITSIIGGRLLTQFCFCFLEPVENKALCTVDLQSKDIDQLREAIEDLYYFEFVLGRVN